MCYGEHFRPIKTPTIAPCHSDESLTRGSQWLKRKVLVSANQRQRRIILQDLFNLLLSTTVSQVVPEHNYHFEQP